MSHRNSSRKPPDAEELARLLDARNEHPESLAAVDEEIWRRFGRTAAVLVLDMCGFSRLTMRYGITHFLAMIRRLNLMARPAIAAAGGTVIKSEADNVFATFPYVAEALAAGRDIQARLREANTFLPEDWDLHASIGIGYGPLLVIEGSGINGEIGHDVFGAELNIAAKLGEDIARGGEIWLSAAAHDNLNAADSGGLSFDAVAVEASGLKWTAFRLRTPSH